MSDESALPPLEEGPASEAGSALPPLPTPEAFARRSRIIGEVSQQYASPQGLDRSTDLYKQVGEGQSQLGGDEGAAAHAKAGADVLESRLKKEAPEYAEDIPELRKDFEEHAKQAGKAHQLQTFMASARNERDTALTLAHRLPWVSAATDVGYYAGLNNAVNKYEKGEADGSDYAQIARHLVREERDAGKSGFDKTADFLSTLPARGIEFMTGATAAKAIAEKLGVSTAEVAAKAGIKKILTNAIIQGAGITATQLPGTVTANVLQRQTPALEATPEGLQIGERENLGLSIGKAVGSALTSNTIFSGAGVFSKTGAAQSYLGHLTESIGALQADKEAQRLFGGKGGLLSNLMVGDAKQREQAMGEFAGEVLGLAAYGAGSRGAERVIDNQVKLLRFTSDARVRTKLQDIMETANRARGEAASVEQAGRAARAADARAGREFDQQAFFEAARKAVAEREANPPESPKQETWQERQAALRRGEYRPSPEKDADLLHDILGEPHEPDPSESPASARGPDSEKLPGSAAPSGEAPEAARGEGSQAPEAPSAPRDGAAESGVNAPVGSPEPDRGQGGSPAGAEPGVSGEPGPAGAETVPGAESRVLIPEPVSKAFSDAFQGGAATSRPGEMKAEIGGRTVYAEYRPDDNSVRIDFEKGRPGVPAKVEPGSKNLADGLKDLVAGLNDAGVNISYRAIDTNRGIYRSKRQELYARILDKAGYELVGKGPDKDGFYHWRPVTPDVAELEKIRAEKEADLAKQETPLERPNLEEWAEKKGLNPELGGTEQAYRKAFPDAGEETGKHADPTYRPMLAFAKAFLHDERASAPYDTIIRTLFGEGWGEKLKDSGKEAGDALRSLRNNVSAAAFPNTHRLSRPAGEAVSELASSNLAAGPEAKGLLAAAFGGDKKLAGRTMAVIVENRLRGENDKLAKENKPPNFESKVGPDGVWKTEAEYQADLKSPEVQAGIKQWNDTVGKWMNEKYRITAGLADDADVPVHGRDFEAPVNLLKAAEATANAKAGGPNPNNPRANFSVFRKRAKGGHEYSVDPEAVLYNTVNTVLEKANRLKAITTLHDEGVGRLVKPGDAIPDKLHDQPVYRLAVDVPNEKGKMVSAGLYLPESLRGELAQAMNTDQRLSKMQILRIGNALQMFGIGDVSWHSINLPLWYAQAPGGKSLIYELAVRGMPGLRTIDAVARPVWKLISAKIDPAAAAKQWAGISRIGAGRAEAHEGGGLLNKPHQGLVAWDKASRMALDDLYTTLVDRKLMADNDASRRDFINNYAGIYNARMMNKWAANLKDVGASPFYSAVTTGLRVGTQALHGGYGGEAASPAAAAQLRTTQAFKNAIAPLALGALGTLAMTGKLWQAGVPIGAIATGGTDEDGKPKYIDLMGAARRGFKDTGIEAGVDSLLRGRTGAQAADASAKDVVNAGAHFVGPGLKGVFEASSGRRLNFDLSHTGGAGPADESKAGGRLTRALYEQNPMVAGGMEAKNKGTNVALGVGKSAIEAGKRLAGMRAGVKPASPAVEMAQEFSRQTAPSDPTAASIEKSKAKRDLRDQAAAAGSVEPIRAALKAGDISQLEAQHLAEDSKRPPIVRAIRYLPLQDALKVWKVASPEEQAQIRPLLVAKYGSILNGQRSPKEIAAAREAWTGVFGGTK